jgi:hypothetical protein
MAFVFPSPCAPIGGSSRRRSCVAAKETARAGTRGQGHAPPRSDVAAESGVCHTTCTPGVSPACLMPRLQPHPIKSTPPPSVEQSGGRSPRGSRLPTAHVVGLALLRALTPFANAQPCSLPPAISKLPRFPPALSDLAEQLTLALQQRLELRLRLFCAHEHIGHHLVRDRLARDL